MQSSLIVALCIVGCLYAVQAKPHRGGRLGDLTREIEFGVDGFEGVPTDTLLRKAYAKLTGLVDTFSVDEAEALRQCLNRYVVIIDKRLYGDRSDVEYLRKTVEACTLKELIEFVKVKDIDVIEKLTEDEIENLRFVLIEFMNDRKPDIMYYLKHGFCNLYGRFDVLTVGKPIERVFTEESSYKELLSEVVRKVYALRDSVWTTKKNEFTNVIVKIIKRADEELIKCNQIEKVEKLIERIPYKSFDTLTYGELVKEAELRIEALFECTWEDETATLKTYLVKFLNTIDEQIVKYNRIE